MNRLLLLLLAIFTTLNLSAQSAGIELNLGYGFYEMDSFKKLLDYYKSESGLTYKQLSNYEPDINLGGTFVVGVGKFETGLDYRYFKTEGELQSDDNGRISGVKFDAVSHALGLFGRHPVIYSEKFQLKLGALASVYSSKAGLTEYSVAANVRQENMREIISKSIVVTGTLEPVYYITGGVYFGLRAGYAYDFTGALHEKKDVDKKLVLDPGDEVRTNWTGIRTDFFIGLRLNP